MAASKLLPLLVLAAFCLVAAANDIKSISEFTQDVDAATAATAKEMEVADKAIKDLIDAAAAASQQLDASSTEEDLEHLVEAVVAEMIQTESDEAAADAADAFVAGGLRLLPGGSGKPEALAAAAAAGMLLKAVHAFDVAAADDDQQVAAQLQEQAQLKWQEEEAAIALEIAAGNSGSDAGSEGSAGSDSDNESSDNDGDNDGYSDSTDASAVEETAVSAQWEVETNSDSIELVSEDGEHQESFVDVDAQLAEAVADLGIDAAADAAAAAKLAQFAADKEVLPGHDHEMMMEQEILEQIFGSSPSSGDDDDDDDDDSSSSSDSNSHSSDEDFDKLHTVVHGDRLEAAGTGECLAGKDRERVKFEACSADQRDQMWQFTSDGRLVHSASQLCLRAHGAELTLAKCHKGSERMHWECHKGGGLSLAHDAERAIVRSHHHEAVVSDSKKHLASDAVILSWSQGASAVCPTEALLNKPTPCPKATCPALQCAADKQVRPMLFPGCFACPVCAPEEPVCPMFKCAPADCSPALWVRPVISPGCTGCPICPPVEVSVTPVVVVASPVAVDAAPDKRPSASVESDAAVTQSVPHSAQWFVMIGVPAFVVVAALSAVAAVTFVRRRQAAAAADAPFERV